MNKDKATTLASAIVAMGVTAGVLTNAEAGVLTQAIGILVSLAMLAWGYFTNKEEKK